MIMIMHGYYRLLQLQGYVDCLGVKNAKREYPKFTGYIYFTERNRIMFTEFQGINCGKNGNHVCHAMANFGECSQCRQVRQAELA